MHALQLGPQETVFNVTIIMRDIADDGTRNSQDRCADLGWDSVVILFQCYSFFFHTSPVVTLALQPRYQWNQVATDDKTGMISSKINSYIIPALSVFLVPLSALFAMLNENQLAHLCNFCRAESSNILKEAILL